MIKARTEVLEFKFQRPATTSRGTHLSKKVQYIILYHDDDPSVAGIGECSVFPGLSFDDVRGFNTKLSQTIDRINQGDYYTDNSLVDWPSINFALETAWNDLRANGSKIFQPSQFTEGKDSIRINGLIWMSDKNEMIRQIRQKLTDGFTCLKLKIGALDLREEIEVLKFIREYCTADELELRVDANGAFTHSEALEVLKILSEYHIHSVEQPIAAGNPEEMARICRSSPIPVALDEELIGKHTTAARRKLLEAIKPAYLVLKPGLLGGIAATKEWLNLAGEMNAGWWVTSSLETNIGLNAIAQWTYTLKNEIYHGLSTGSLYNNNIRSPLYMNGERLYHDPERKWDLTPLQIE